MKEETVWVPDMINGQKGIATYLRSCTTGSCYIVKDIAVWPTSLITIFTPPFVTTCTPAVFQAVDTTGIEGQRGDILFIRRNLLGDYD